jgi:DNA-3-methyladenine glycosylase II
MSAASRPVFDIAPAGAFSLRASGDFIGAWHQAPSEGHADGGHLHLAFLTDAGWKPVGVCLTQSADSQVHGEVYGDTSAAEVQSKVARIMSLDVDGSRWPEVGLRDPVVGRLQRLFPGFRPVNWSDAYEAAAWCLISSRVSMRQAQGVKDRLSREIGHEVDIHGHRMWAFPGPSRLIELKSFRGLFGRKLEYLNKLGEAALADWLDTERLRAMAPAACLTELRRLPGIGEWGAQLIRLRALSAVDEMPTTEPRLLAALREAYELQREPDMATLEGLSEAWRPFRMWVCVCLRRSGGEGAGMMHSRASG